MKARASAAAEQPEAPSAEPGAREWLDVFISYSRRDAEFVHRLYNALEERGKDAWVDSEDIPATTVWRERIRAGIESANAFAFVLSPDSIASPECGIELDVAIEANKRIVPILHRDVDPKATPAALADLMWLTFRDGDDFGAAFESLVESLETDQKWLVAHTRLLSRAREWDMGGRDRSFLLQGSDLAAAEQWLRTQEGHKEPATPLQIDFIVASRQSSTRRQRITLGGVTAALGVSLALTALALALRHQAVDREHTARSRELAAEAEAQLAGDPLLAMYLARRGVEIKQTTQAEAALRHAVQTPLRSVLTEPAKHGRLSADGRRVVTIDQAGTLRVWEALGGTLVRALRTRGGFVDAALSPDGDNVAGLGSDGSVRVWALGEKRGPNVLPRGSGTFGASIAYSDDGRRIITVGHDQYPELAGSVRMWDLSASPPKLVFDRHQQSVTDALLSPDGRRIMSVGQVGDFFSERYTVRVWDLQGRRREVLLRVAKTAMPTFSPDGRRIATAGSDGVVKVWDVARPKSPLVLQGHVGPVETVAFSPNGRRVVSAGEDGTVRVWDAAGRAKPVVLRGHKGALVSAAFSAGGRSIVSVGGDDHTVRVWDWPSQRSLAVVRTDDDQGLSASDFSPNGRLVLTIGKDEISREGTVRVWNVEAPTVLHDRDDLPVNAAAFSADGRRVVFAGMGGDVVVSDVAGRQPQKFLPHTDSAQDYSAAFSPDGSRVAIGGEDGVRVWRTGAKRATPLPYDFTALTVAFTPAGLSVVAVATAGGVLVWGTSPPRELKTFPVDEGPVYRSGLSPDGRLLATPNFDGRVSIWDLSRGRRLERLVGHLGEAFSAAFSPDGRLVVSAGTDGTVRVWDWAHGRSLALLRGHVGAVEAAAFSPDGERVVSGGWDGTVRVWSWETAEAPVVLRGHVGIVRAVAFSPDGRRILSAGEDGTTRIWSCDGCGSFEDAYALARQLVPREPAPAVRGTFPPPISD